MRKIIFLIAIVSLNCGYFGCQKLDSTIGIKQTDPFVLEVLNYLESKVEESEMQSLDLKKISIFKNEKNQSSILRIFLKGKKDQFIVVGKIEEGFTGNWVKISQDQVSHANSIHTISFDKKEESKIVVLNNKVVSISKAINGKVKKASLKYKHGTTIKSHTDIQSVSGDEYDVDNEQWMPTVSVYAYRSGYSGTYYSWYWYFNQNPAYLYTYTPESPSSYGGNTGSTIEVQPNEINSGPGVEIQKLFNCFNGVSSTGATYSITLHADLPINSDPNALVTGLTPGHVFLTMKKTNGSQSVSQTFGFYPVESKLSVFDAPVNSKVVNDGNHEYNASITMNNLSEVDFNAAMNLASGYANSLQYDLNDFNCTNFAVDIFNNARPTNNQITVLDWQNQSSSSIALNFGMTPNGLYKTLKQIKDANGPDAANINIGVFSATASQGQCN